MYEEIVERADELGLRVWLHATDIDGSGSVDIGADDEVVTASVFKVPVALELSRQAALGELDLAEQITVEPPSPVASPYGLATFRHPVRLSLDALATLMIGISDNLATDIVLERVGRSSVARLLDRLELRSTVVNQDCREILTGLRDDLLVACRDSSAVSPREGERGQQLDEHALGHLTLDRLADVRALTPSATCRTSPRDMTRLLSLIWRDEAASATACADVRRWLGLQVWPHRLRSGFDSDDVQISGKTGTLPTIRNEVGVVEYAGGRRFAVAVFTKAQDARAQVPARDAFIGYAAARAIARLS